MPTRLWKAAISCGSAVILILSPTTVPMEPPINIPRRIIDKLTTPGSARVDTMAMTMPATP